MSSTIIEHEAPREVHDARPDAPTPALAGRSSLHYLGASLSEAALFSRLMWQAGVGGKDTTPQQVLARVMQGLELGLPPMTAIRELYVVDGKCGMSSRLMHALARKGGAKLRIVETTDKIARVAITPPGEADATAFEWNIDMATKAGLLKKWNWQNYTQQLLLSRAISFAINYACPEVLGGAGMYERDELLDTLEEPDDGLTQRERAAKAASDFDNIFSGRAPAKATRGAKELPAKSEPAPDATLTDAPAEPDAAQAMAAEGRPKRERTAKPEAKAKPAPKPEALDNGTQAMASAMTDAAMEAGVYLLGGRVEVDAAMASSCGLEVREYAITTLIDMVNAREILAYLRDAKVIETTDEAGRG